MEFSVAGRLENGSIIAEVTVPKADETTQYAYYLCEKNQGVLEKRMYTGETTCSFQPPCAGQYYVRAYVRWREAGSPDYTIVAKNTKFIGIHSTKHLRYEELEQEDFQAERGIFYDILWDGLHYEFFIQSKPKSTQAIILGTGDVGQHPRPYFSRISWANEFPCTSIYYSDPASYLPPCTLGWGYGANDRWYLKDIAVLLQKILEKLNIRLEDTLFYGSSGGGFTAMLLASMFRSRASVINPQFIVENYHESHVKLMKQACLKEGETLIPERTNALALFQQTGYFPPLHVMQNIYSDRDIKTQITPFLEQLSANPMDCNGRLRLDFYADEGGHGAMPPKELCLRQMEEDLSLPIPQPVELSPAPDR